MIGYSLVGTNDFDSASRFYDDVFSEIGVGRAMEHGQTCMWGEEWAGSKPLFGVTVAYDGQAATIGNGSMPALMVSTRDEVDRVFARVMQLGGADEGGPGVRGPDSDKAFYGAYFRDLDGNKLCVYAIGPGPV